jgi:N-acyl-D-aspartate/D-glutamate deacylase
MSFDLLIRDGVVVDGSGLPRYRADVGVKDGKIAEVGRLRESAARTIDAGGLVVAPGFIDHHTHLDAQILWDPYGTSEPAHGVTTVVMGNCGLALAPVRPGGEDALVKSFVRVEAMPREALEAGVPWGWRSYGDYLDRLEGKVGVNVAGLVGHIAVRHAVMGEEAVEREATDEEVDVMKGLVHEALEGGALGMSTNRNERHFREDGKPVSSRLASDDELFALCDVFGEANTGVIQVILGFNKVEHMPWYDALAKRTGRPIIWQIVLHSWNQPTLWREQLEAIAPTFRDGYRAYGLTNTAPLYRRFTIDNVQVFDEFPVWKNVMFLPKAVRNQALADPETRRKLKDDFNADRPVTFHRRWDLLEVIGVGQPENQRYLHKSLADVAAMRGQDPIDAFLDVALDDPGLTVLTSNGGDPEATRQILSSPYILIGESDAGAHVQFDANFGYGTFLLSNWVRDKGLMSLEQAVHKLTFQVASIYGIEGRGLIRPGYAADLTLFDPDTVAPCEPEWAEDFPANTKRMVQRSEGLYYTIVNGAAIYDHGALSGDLPGTVIRGSALRR